MINNILGDASQGLNGSEIHHFLLLANIDNLDATNTKRYRLYNKQDKPQRQEQQICPK